MKLIYLILFIKMENDKENSNNQKEIVVEIEDYNPNDKRDKDIEYRNVENAHNSNNSVIRNNQDIINDDNDDRDLRDADDRKFEVPEHLKKTFMCSTILFIIGLILIGIGFIEEIQAVDPTEGIAFWVIGGIVMIPGGYYTYQFCKARRSTDLQEREDILNDIPEL